MSSPKNRRSLILVDVVENLINEGGIQYKSPTCPDSQFKMAREDEKINEINENYEFNPRKERRRTGKKLQEQEEKMLEYIFSN